MKSLTSSRQLEVVINIDYFRSQLRECLLRPELLAIATVRSRETVIGEELIIEEWQAAQSSIRAESLPIFHRFAVLAIANEQIPSSNELLSAISPQGGQTCIAIVIQPRRVNELDIVVFAKNEQSPPTKIHFSGSRVDSVVHPNLERLDTTDELPAIDDLRGSRTAGALGQDLAAKVRQLRMLVVGAGSGGSEVVRQFASLSPSRITVVDGDTVGEENLNNLPHATNRDVKLGRYKVDVLLRSIRRNQRQRVSLTGIRTMLHSPETIRHLSCMPRFSGLVTFIDNDGGRLAAAMLAKQLHLPQLDIGTLIQGGEQRIDIRLFAPGGQGCVACVPKNPNLAAMLYAARSPAGVMLPGEPTTWNQHRDGSLLPLNSLAVGEAVRLWLRYLKGSVGSTWIRAFSVNDSPLEWHSVAVAEGFGCEICR